MKTDLEKCALQGVVALASLVPIIAGGYGMFLGPGMLGGHPAELASLDSHFRYLSGLLFAIGLGYASTIPRIETKNRRFGLLTGIVFVGGIGRLLSATMIGPPSTAGLGALAMELVIAPTLAGWQIRVARRADLPA